MPADAGAVAVVKAALADPAIKVRKAALDLIESLGSGGAAWRDALKERAVLEEDPKLREDGRPAGRASRAWRPGPYRGFSVGAAVPPRPPSPSCSGTGAHFPAPSVFTSTLANMPGFSLPSGFGKAT